MNAQRNITANIYKMINMYILAILELSLIFSLSTERVDIDMETFFLLFRKEFISSQDFLELFWNSLNFFAQYNFFEVRI